MLDLEDLDCSKCGNFICRGYGDFNGAKFYCKNCLKIICFYCSESVIGDPKYHQVYENGLLVGVRHRNCGRNL